MENGDPNNLFQSISGISTHNIGNNDTEAGDIQSYLMKFVCRLFYAEIINHDVLSF